MFARKWPISCIERNSGNFSFLLTESKHQNRFDWRRLNTVINVIINVITGLVDVYNYYVIIHHRERLREYEITFLLYTSHTLANRMLPRQVWFEYFFLLLYGNKLFYECRESLVSVNRNNIFISSDLDVCY